MSTSTNKTSLAVSISSHVLYSDLFISRSKKILRLYRIIFMKDGRIVTVNKTYAMLFKYLTLTVHLI